MRKAVQLVEEGKSLRFAASATGVKYPTLFRYVRKKRNAADANIRMRPNYECRRIFSLEQERSLVDYILKSSKMFYGLSTEG